MTFVIQEIQPTPNPNAMKYVLNGTVSEKTESFFTPDHAQVHPLAAKLFTIKGVTNVMLLGDFITIGKQPQARWSDINARVKQALAANTDR